MHARTLKTLVLALFNGLALADFYSAAASQPNSHLPDFPRRLSLSAPEPAPHNSLAQQLSKLCFTY